MLRLAWLVLFLAPGAFPSDPRYTPDGQLIRPENYREWVFLSSGLGMTYGPNAAPGEPRFDNVFVNPESYRAFLATGKWPDRTIFALEIRRSSSRGSINKAGHFQTDVVAVEFEIKDESRFPGKWGFFGFTGPAGKQPATAKAIAAGSSCHTCHGANGASDNTFVQFYPEMLEVARRKGTLRQEFLAAEAAESNR